MTNRRYANRGKLIYVFILDKNIKEDELMIFEDIDKYKNKNGIYMILNTVTNYKYIGCTKSGFLNRFKRHLWELEKSCHHNDYLQKSYNKYGTDSFKFIVLEILDDVSNIENREIYYIEKFDSYNNGYNLTKGGEGFVGLTEESRKKVGEKNRIRLLGGKLSDETKRKMSESRKGRKLSSSQKQSLLKANIGRKVSNETKNKIAQHFLGSKSNLAILDEDSVYVIKQMIMDNIPDDIIAEKYNVKKSCISNIRYNYRWKHVIVDGWDDYQKNRPHKTHKK